MMKPRRYFQFVERDANEISIIWKVLHVLIFTLTAFISLAAACGFANIFDIFHYRCVLHGKPEFIITNCNRTNEQGDAFREMMSRAAVNGSDWETATPVPGKPGIFIYDNQIWVHNESMCGVVYMQLTRTVFTPGLMCDLVLFVSLLSLVVSTVLGSVALVCGRGGRGYPSDTIRSSWIYVYPIIVASGIMTILSFVVMNLVNKGLYLFCQQFEKFTGRSECSYLMDYFTIQQMGDLRHFYINHEVCKYTYPLMAAFWSIQLLVTCTRVARAEDFRFDQVIVTKKDDAKGYGDEQEEQQVWDTITIPKLYIVEDTPTSRKKTTKSKVIPKG